MQAKLKEEVDTLKSKLSQANQEVVRLRTALNQIAWPIHFNIELRSLDVALCQKIAQDALAIARLKCESRNRKETDGSSDGRTETC